jgi:hypothetical protein
MPEIRSIDLTDRTDKRLFVRVPYDLHQGRERWVPPPRRDEWATLDPRRNPFFEHSTAEFLVALRDGQPVGRIVVAENRRSNAYKGERRAFFSLFEAADDPEVVRALFDRAFDWARARKLSDLVGPRGLSPFDGYGVLVEGFEHRRMMTMTSHDPRHYAVLLEREGFTKELDFVSWYFHLPDVELTPGVAEIAERARERASFRVHQFRNRRELLSWIPRIGQAYNATFEANWEYYPLTDAELRAVADAMIPLLRAELIKILVADDDLLGFLLVFPDVSAALQRARGRLLPFGLLDILLERRRTDWVSINGIGILQTRRGLGGNALLYAELLATLRSLGQFRHVEVTQVADTAERMTRDLLRLGARKHKTHRVYSRDLSA